MTSRLAFGLAASLAGLILQGCAVSGSPDFDARFGDAARQLNAQQLIAPGAPLRNADHRTRLDGRTAREARDSYVESYSSPPQSSVIQLNIGTGK